jgi:hypothetical protein
MSIAQRIAIPERSGSAVSGQRPADARLERRTGLRPRVAGFAYVTLLPPAAFAVHQLRYWLAFGSNAAIELQRTGHSYLHSVVPWLIVLLTLAAGVFLRRLGRAFSGHTSPARFGLSLTAFWLVCSVALVAIFACQEFLEGLFATGHPAGWEGIFGYGGWWSIPAASCVGLVLATVLHGARWLVQEVARRRARPFLAAFGRPLRVVRPRDAVLVPAAPMVKGWSGRGPPTLA